jgi:hypothetical protein
MADDVGSKQLEESVQSEGRESEKKCQPPYYCHLHCKQLRPIV